MQSVKEALIDARSRLVASGVESAALDARLLLAYVMNVPQETLIAHPDFRLDEGTKTQFEAVLVRRVAREPLAYIIGEKEFWGRSFGVNADTLIPRPDSETMIELMLKQIDSDMAVELLELGCGSGCLVVSLLAERPAMHAVAVDKAGGAVDATRKNAERHEVADRLAVMQSDWDAALDDGMQFDWICSNPPYIATKALDGLEADVRDYEPRLALDGGTDGMDAYEAVEVVARRRLKPLGALVLEAGDEAQADAMIDLYEARGWRCVAARRDLAGTRRALQFSRVN